MRATNGELYVLKLANNPLGPNALFNEPAGIELYRTFRLHVPRWEPLLLTEAFLSKKPDWRIENSNGRVCPEPGLCLGIRYLGDSEHSPIKDLPPSSFERIRNRTSFWMAWLLDICCRRTDHREALFLEIENAQFDAYFVDFESQFGKFDLEVELRKRGAKRLTDSFASRYPDDRIYPPLSLTDAGKLKWLLKTFDLEDLHSRVRRIPREWWAPSTAVSYMGAVSRLRDGKLIESIVNLFLDFSRSNSKPRHGQGSGD